LAFFQTALLAGYAYAHLTARWLAPRWQALVHLVLMLAAAATLRITFPAIAVAPDESPRLWFLAALLRSVGPSFVVIAGTALMVQRWFAASRRPGSRDCISSMRRATPEAFSPCSLSPSCWSLRCA